MKTLKSIQKEISDIISEIKEADRHYDKKSATLSKRLRAKLSKLKYFKMYLETNPSDDYCKKEIERIENRINKIEQLYELPENPERFTRGQLSLMKKDYEKQWDVPKLKKQLMTLYYISK